jgi:hypothetical protein
MSSQADPYGIQCEFCTTPREIVVQSPPVAAAPPSSADEEPSLFRKIGSYKELAQVRANSHNTS